MSIIPNSTPDTYQSLKDIFLHYLKDVFIYLLGVEKGKETWTICLLQAEVKFSIVVLLVFDLLPMFLICCSLCVWYCCLRAAALWMCSYESYDSSSSTRQDLWYIYCCLCVHMIVPLVQGCTV
jgi:hypothetical protein